MIYFTGGAIHFPRVKKGRGRRRNRRNKPPVARRYLLAGCVVWRKVPVDFNDWCEAVDFSKAFGALGVPKHLIQ